jgi:ABC-type sugar transport system substrate-binding protein
MRRTLILLLAVCIGQAAAQNAEPIETIPPDPKPAWLDDYARGVVDTFMQEKKQAGFSVAVTGTDRP